MKCVGACHDILLQLARDTLDEFSNLVQLVTWGPPSMRHHGVQMCHTPTKWHDPNVYIYLSVHHAC